MKNTENIKSKAKITVLDGKFSVNGKKLWINGVNTPWHNWNDFGGKFEEDFWDSHFNDLKKAGVNATRIWINCCGFTGVVLNDDGSFKKVNEKHWHDLDRLMEIAKKHEIYVMATLLSFDHFKDKNIGYESWRKMLEKSENIDSFVEGYVVPLVKRYKDNDYMWSIDLVNEPDWINETDECGRVDWNHLGDYFARACAAVHENSDILVTVGIGVVKNNSDSYAEKNKVGSSYLESFTGNKNSYVDFNSVHYYDWQKKWFGYPFGGSPEEFRLDGSVPCVIGECGINDGGSEPIALRYSQAFENGWDGVMAWTSNGVDACGGYDGIAPVTAKMYNAHKELIRPFE